MKCERCGKDRCFCIDKIGFPRKKGKMLIVCDIDTDDVVPIQHQLICEGYYD